ncbi:hypothetical protein KCP75_24745 [Salmonella enterica subsp. enterica]|nr:hypothetical protein KCP75_24745 [Salmonella enterica subsp. enterica]
MGGTTMLLYAQDPRRLVWQNDRYLWIEPGEQPARVRSGRHLPVMRNEDRGID